MQRWNATHIAYLFVPDVSVQFYVSESHSQSRGVYESPGMTALYLAHLDLEAFCLDREVLKAMRSLKDLMTDYVYNGIFIYVRLAELSPRTDRTLQCSFFYRDPVVTFCVFLRVAGFWYSPECEYVRECLLRGQSDVNGKVKLRLYKGSGK
jgi:argininosuccinate synthase